MLALMLNSPMYSLKRTAQVIPVVEYYHVVSYVEQCQAGTDLEHSFEDSNVE